MNVNECTGLLFSLLIVFNHSCIIRTGVAPFHQNILPLDLG